MYFPLHIVKISSEALNILLLVWNPPGLNSHCGLVILSTSFMILLKFFTNHGFLNPLTWKCSVRSRMMICLYGGIHLSHHQNSKIFDGTCFNFYPSYLWLDNSPMNMSFCYPPSYSKVTSFMDSPQVTFT